MEVKVEVHTVHPTSPELKHDRSKKTNTTHGSWCTPDSSPTRNSEIPEKVEATTQPRPYTEKEKALFRLQKALLFGVEEGSSLQSKLDEVVRLNELEEREEDKVPVETAERALPGKVEATTQIRDGTEQYKAYFRLQKALLFEDEDGTPMQSKLDDVKRIKELEAEIDELKKTKACLDTAERPPEDDKKCPEVEAPQSPVPSSPTRTKKGLWYICDILQPIDPQGRLYITWLMLVTFCYSYNSWCIPLRVTFPYQTPENLHVWLAMDYMCDLIYVLDVAMVKPKLMYLHEGFWVDDPEETRKNYRKKTQYKFDVISTLPLDILYIFFGPKMVFLRFPRLLKLQTFWEFHQTMDRVLSSPYAVRIGKTLFYIFYMIHLNACAYYAMSDYIGLGTNGWVYDNQGNAYIRCFYFATKTATSIGKNPKPENTIEYLFMTAAWLMGVFVFALLIGQIRDIIATATRARVCVFGTLIGQFMNILATANRARTEYRKTVDNCVRYLRRLNVPTEVQRRVNCWFYYTWTKQRCFDEEKILDVLPFNMKRDVALAVHMSTLSKVQLFRDCSKSLLRDLVLQMKSVTFLPGDLVVRKGDVGHHMYIIKSGECCVMSNDETEVLANLKEGSVFGEISLLGIEGLRHRTATVRSRGFSNLFLLSRMDLDAALQHHKEAAKILRLRADQIIRENATRQAKLRLAEEEAKRAASSTTGDDKAARRRRSSLASHRGRRRRSNTSKRRLSVVTEASSNPSISQSEDQITVVEVTKRSNTPRAPDRASRPSGVPHHDTEAETRPIPTIVFTSDDTE